MTITAGTVEAFLNCPTKCYLRSLGELGTENAYANWAQAQNESYHNGGIRRLALLAEELVKLGRESKSRADVDFAHTPKQAGTERSTEIHRTFEGLLKSGHSNYLKKRMRFRALEIQAFEQFVSSVRELLAPIFNDIRRFGLKALHLRKYQKDVERFYKDTINGHPIRHEITARYQKRFERYRNSIFCFLGVDGIPWNNNAAERALRHLNTAT
jgi:hypothetical protein